MCKEKGADAGALCWSVRSDDFLNYGTKQPKKVPLTVENRLYGLGTLGATSSQAHATGERGIHHRPGTMCF